MRFVALLVVFVLLAINLGSAYPMCGTPEACGPGAAWDASSNTCSWISPICNQKCDNRIITIACNQKFNDCCDAKGHLRTYEGQSEQVQCASPLVEHPNVIDCNWLNPGYRCKGEEKCSFACGAQCEKDSDCPSGMKCDQDECKCVPEEECKPECLLLLPR